MKKHVNGKDIEMTAQEEAEWTKSLEGSQANDDKIAANTGFDTHPHQNMEIISIPLSGDLEHKDSMGNTTVIKEGDIQVMSAGTGVQHSEYNKNKDEEVRFLQIWVIPNKQNVEPRYDQITLDKADRKNKLQQILSPNKEDEGVWIYQDAWFHLTDLEAGKSLTYDFKKASNGLYIFVLEGSITAGDQSLSRRDGLAIYESNPVELKASENASVLLMEVPLQLS